MSAATVTTIGQEIGKMNIDIAKLYYQITAFTVFILIVVVNCNFYLFNSTIIGWFTSIEAVHKVIDKVLIFFVLAIFPDCWQGYLQGVLKALGI